MKFTPTEWEILCHRLAVPDALAEALSEPPLYEEGAEYERLYDECHELEKIGRIIPNPTERQLEILRDCCEGCTMFADIEDAVALGDLTRSRMDYLFKSAQTLGVKLNAHVCTH